MIRTKRYLKKHQFTQAQRFVIWTCERDRCCWCGYPINFLEMTVAHVVPEHLQEKREDYKEYREASRPARVIQYQRLVQLGALSPLVQQQQESKTAGCEPIDSASIGEASERGRKTQED